MSIVPVMIYVLVSVIHAERFINGGALDFSDCKEGTSLPWEGTRKERGRNEEGTPPIFLGEKLFLTREECIHLNPT